MQREARATADATLMQMKSSAKDLLQLAIHLHYKIFGDTNMWPPLFKPPRLVHTNPWFIPTHGSYQSMSRDMVPPPCSSNLIWVFKIEINWNLSHASWLLESADYTTPCHHLLDTTHCRSLPGTACSPPPFSSFFLLPPPPAPAPPPKQANGIMVHNSVPWVSTLAWTRPVIVQQWTSMGPVTEMEFLGLNIKVCSSFAIN